MTHLEEGTLQAFLDENLDATAKSAAAGHLAQCSSCAAELDTLRRAAALFSSSVALVDTQPATARALRSTHERSAGETKVIPLHRRFASRSLARAAILVLGFAAAASAAIPGSPVREWLERAFAGDEQSSPATATHDTAAPTAPAVAQPQPIPAGPLPTSGVAVSPENGRIDVALKGTTSTVRVVLVDADRAVVLAAGEAASVNFATGPGHVVVTGGGAGEIRIELPRAVKAVITLNGRDLFVRDAGAPSSSSEFVFPTR